MGEGVSINILVCVGAEVREKGGVVEEWVEMEFRGRGCEGGLRAPG